MMNRPVRKSLSPKNLTLMGIPRKFHDLTLDDFDTSKSEGLGKVRDYVEDYVNSIDSNFKNNTGIYFCGSNGVGKAQPLDAEVLTPNGFVEMGDLKIGDFVYGRDGKPTQILGIFPQGRKKAYRVTLLDGRVTECSSEHLWTYITSRKNLKTLTLDAMLKMGLKDKRGAYRFKVPNNEPVEFSNSAELPLEPYVLGCLLGDGCFSCMDGGKNKMYDIFFSNTEQDVIDRLNKELFKHGEQFKKNVHTQCSHYLNQLNKNVHKRDGYTFKAIESLGLYGVKGENKFIPPEYLFSSIENRINLLQGLMDTDGHVSSNGSFSFSTFSPQLCKDVLFLARSIGIQCSYSLYGREYDIWLLTDKRVFSSVKHNERYTAHLKESSAKNRSKYCVTPIASVEYIGEKEMQCLLVDNKEHLYLTDDFIVTHNTMLSCFIVKEAYRHRYTAQRVTFSEYVKRYTDMWGAKTPSEKEALEEEFYQRYKAVEFLVLEEIGKEMDTKAVRPILEDLLRYREDEGFVTIICTNLAPKQLREIYGESIYSLIRGNLYFVKIEGDDVRKESK